MYVGERVKETSDSRAARMTVDGDNYTARGEIVGGPYLHNGTVRYWLVRWDNATHTQPVFESEMEVDHEPQPYAWPDDGEGAPLDVASHNARVAAFENVAREAVQDMHEDTYWREQQYERS